ncbi:S8 family serine peptidase [Spirosoma sordidisoli]|uniref:T9SS type A sorting domain-containing protein n=1 Tax=Spirosoma sordidisoli TaxID=2502893 RepID=A0A4Q2UJK3_9BACT|nr:S8 family serine peptidase [Spirosoma sordidisoli]RYC69336.1 T9SS type A sorting domain-containing protein [Spirosoma sordidisoli]
MAFNKSTPFVPLVLTKAGWLVTLFVLVSFSVAGQTNRKYLVLLRDKASSPYSIDRPGQFLSQRAIQRRQKQNIAVLERDLPVTPAYVAQIQQTGARIWYTSRWFNAVLVETNETTLATIQRLPFVAGVEFNKSLANARLGETGRVASLAQAGSAGKFGAVEPLNYGNSLNQVTQIGADKMHQAGYRGEGMLIGVLDSGFLRANQLSFLKPLFDEKRILATYDFVRKETSVYEDDSHGLSCLSAIAATADNQLYGTAFKAQFILLRTEDAGSEQRIEEANWLFGAEYADSAGVDVISSSLGYTTFDDPASGYTYRDMNGKTALSSRAAQIAAETGMVVVVAAGNEGSGSWRYLSAPSDAAAVLAIGAVTQTGQRAAFSSFGPSADGRVKPDLAARGQGTLVGSPGGQIVSGNGTSFATPLVAGLAAGFWQANPRLTAAQVTDALRRSGSQYTSPDDQVGYGIPNFERAMEVARTYSQFLIYPNPFSDSQPLAVQWGDVQANTTIDATLTDLAGRVVWSNRYTPAGLAAFVLPPLNLSAGLYVMTLVAGDQKRSIKVIKQ